MNEIMSFSGEWSMVDHIEIRMGGQTIEVIYTIESMNVNTLLAETNGEVAALWSGKCSVDAQIRLC